MKLVVDHLVKRFGRFTAVNELCMEIPSGAIFGFVGPNGAGKTTTMKIMAGLLSADSGAVLLDGQDALAAPRLLQDRMGYMPDFFGVYDSLRVSEYMDFYAGTYYIPYADRPALIDNLLELVDLTHKKDAYVDSLSRGMKQRLCLARSLIHDPDILILDEPASGLDPRARLEMKEILKQLGSLGKTVIISSHILPELAEMCTEIGIIDGGRLKAHGSVNEIMQMLSQTRHIYARALGGMEHMLALLRQDPLVGAITQNTDDVEFAFDGDDAALSRLLSTLVGAGLPMVAFKEKEGNLEEIFMQVTGGEPGL